MAALAGVAGLEVLDAGTFAGKLADLKRASRDEDRTMKVLKPVLRSFQLSPAQAVDMVKTYTSFSGRCEAGKVIQKARPAGEFPGWFDAFVAEAMTPRLFEFPKMQGADRDKLEREDRQAFCKALGVEYCEPPASSSSPKEGVKVNIHSSYQG